jgi:hypothetical protein
MCAGIYEIFHDFAGPVATIIGATAAVFVTWRLGSGQLRIAEEQRRIAQEQKEFADLRLNSDVIAGSAPGEQCLTSSYENIFP